jgi:protein-S-isoprenylcysteine O-methyltransferase Ste14
MLLLVIFILLVWLMLYLALKYPQIPASWLWPAVWTVMGVVIVFLALLYSGWGSILNDRETLHEMFK